MGITVLAGAALMLGFLANRKRAKMDRAYVAGPLAALLGENGADARIDRLTGGKHACASRVVFSGGGAGVVVRWWPWDAKKRKGAEHAHLARLLGGHGIPVPDFVALDDSEATRKRFGGEAAIERFVEGGALAPPWTDDELRSLAAMVAALHAIRSPQSGKPWRPFNEQADLAGYVRARWLQSLSRARKTLSGAPPDRVAERAMRKGLAWVAARKPFELVHNDLSVNNILRATGGGLALCDFGATAFGCFEQDLAVLECSMFRNRPADLARFLDAYFSASPDASARRALWEERKDFFIASMSLEKAVSHARRRVRPGADERYWRAFLEAFERL